MIAMEDVLIIHVLELKFSKICIAEFSSLNIYLLSYGLKRVEETQTRKKRKMILVTMCDVPCLVLCFHIYQSSF